MHLLLRETCILAAGAQQAGALRRLELGANPVGGVAAPLLLALTVSPPSGRGPEDPPRPSISVSLRECELSAKDAKLKFDWLHAIPVVATRTQNHRAPWRFRFHLDDPLERALCEETLRLTAADSGGVFRFVAVNVRHKSRGFRRAHKQAPAMVMEVKPDEDSRPASPRDDGAGGVDGAAAPAAGAASPPPEPADGTGPRKRKDARRKAAKAPAKRPEGHDAARARKSAVRKILDTIDFARSTDVNFVALERWTSPGGSAALDRAAAIEAEAAKLFLPRLRARGKDIVERKKLDAAAALRLFRTADAACTEADVARAFLLLDWDGSGAVDRHELMRHVAVELTALLRQHARREASDAYWYAPREAVMRRCAHGPAEHRGKAAPVPWHMPRAGILDLRFLVGPPNLEERPIAAEAQVRTLLRAVDDCDDARKAMELAYQARIRLGVDDALRLAKGLIARDRKTSTTAADAEYAEALRRIQSNDKAAQSKIQALVSVLPLLKAPLHARALRDEILGRVSGDRAESGHDLIKSWRVTRLATTGSAERLL